jgi:dTDP-4-amino-4,6-dideoxygalactose transaminase
MRKDESERMKDENIGRSLGRPLSLFSSFRFNPLSFILPPSLFPLVPLAVPYWNGATYRSIVQSFVAGNVIAGPELGKLKSAVIEMLGAADAFLCGSGSLALELALRACGVGRRDEVVIPTFCCTAVVSSIVAAGAIPVLADVGAELNITAATVEAALSKKTKAIIVPHLFGNPADIGSITDLVKGRNIHVIDDAAQALGAAIDGRPVGSFGDVGITSFGREKVCSGLGGGVVVSRNKNILDEISKVDLSKPRRSGAVKNCASTLVCRHWRRWSLPLQVAFSRAPQDGPDTPPRPYRQETMANLNAAVALSLMQSLHDNIACRRARVGAYQELFGGDERLQLIAHRSGSACLTQVVRVLPRRRDEDFATRVLAALAQAGYEVQGSYVPIHLLPGYEQCAWDRLSNAEKIWSDLIELPCEPTVGLDNMKRIAEIVKDSLRSC